MYFGRGIRIKSPCLCCAVAEPTRLLHGIVNLTPPCNNTRVIIIIGWIFCRQRETGRQCPFDDARTGDTVVSIQNPCRSFDTPGRPQLLRYMVSAFFSVLLRTKDVFAPANNNTHRRRVEKNVVFLIDFFVRKLC